MTLSGPVALIGFKGCGKSTVGRALAELLGVEAFDTDEMLETTHRVRTGQNLTFRAIYGRHGADYFRALEKEVLTAALARGPSVISTGGSALSTAAEAGLDLSGVTFVYLTVEPDTLYGRIVKNGMPAFFDKDEPRKFFDKMVAERRALYERYAHITVDNTSRTPGETAREIADALAAR